ncbi:LuxR C-terminal-related transcriptional regulator [Flavobacterium laiguense]|uniref:HTH luxR-type domain-containing protein n=1 Tax=Flavobacterium laiguense TaxID=2169409 RepID=A0A2U1JK45_9FLAO|nr:LuxR C-terminal-related transcriptional regulator [Flavobacterium laiguense]PWA05521.1 hypothetical protein DB891_16835 [Flavobacterium laiguense]
MTKEITSEDYYIHFIDYLQSKEEFQLKENKQYLKRAVFFNNQLDIMPCILYLLDLQKQRYLHVCEDITSLIGYSSDDFLNFGHSWFLNLFHPNDLKEYLGVIFKEFVHYTSSLDKKQIKNARFSINYRLKHKEEIYVQFLDQFIVLETDENNNPILLLGTYNDITPYKSDNTIIFSVSEFDPKEGNILISSKTFPENIKMTSKEKEIIILLKDGETSKSIASKLNISLHTVNAHRRHILEKLQLKKTSELISYCAVNGYI